MSHAVEKAPEDKLKTCVEEMRKKWYRCCAVAIVNSTPYELLNRRIEMKEGTTDGIAAKTIGAGQFEVICSHKRNWSLRGCIGVVTYIIRGMDQSSNHILQVAWLVPFRVKKVYFNVKMGTSTASNTLISNMLGSDSKDIRLSTVNTDNTEAFSSGPFNFCCTTSGKGHFGLLVEMTTQQPIVPEVPTKPRYRNANQTRDGEKKPEDSKPKYDKDDKYKAQTNKQDLMVQENSFMNLIFVVKNIVMKKLWKMFTK